MFASHTKRPRDDEEGDTGRLDDERYIKRVRSWASRYAAEPSHSRVPDRPSVLVSLTPLPPDLATLTPANSSPSDTEVYSPHRLQNALQPDNARLSSPRAPTIVRGGGVDMDMDDTEMDDRDSDDHDDFDMVHSPPYDGSFSGLFSQPLRPAKLDSTLFRRRGSVGEDEGIGGNATGRLPTPMYPNFPPATTAVPALRSCDGLLSAGTGGPTLLGVPNPHHPNFIPIPHVPPVPLPKKHAHIIDHDRARRMPSPISEDEDLPDTPTAWTQSQLERLSVTGERQFHMEIEESTPVPAASVATTDLSTSAHPEGSEPPGVLTTPTRGRKRSGALSSGRGRFSMGYREDCEKCRMRVPGHYSHFLPN
ncbi:uncharacterized protein EI97DRAFT_460512 [Westerdykella ornata]|uniref:Uncharacterized protein n=1 Tax=Westerdykella ornata TaxID=318751 RepID=A0A6A6JFZ7_WESOR|nr:uncharacterized protein EI97DRAFT_460512 [Westerdykella ornata]KAF2274119.1 hypothetical protein EI97DRAFT_460512 [Westerdykella ornata]